MSAAYQKLVAVFDGYRSRGTASGKVFSTQRLVDLVGEIPSVALAQVIADLVQRGQLKQFLRVVSDGGEGLQDFDSFDSLPDEVYDWRTTYGNVRVTPRNLQVCYRLTTH